MVDDIFQTFEDPDNNFVEQFQTTGFDARYFELYLYAYLVRSGFEIDRSQPAPDFIVKRDDVRVAIEATTVNPATSGVIAQRGKVVEGLSENELKEYMANELPIRFGSPLLSKLRKRYWDLPQCQGIPLVIAIEAFHEPNSLIFSDNSLSSYLYGLSASGSFDLEGRLSVSARDLTEHALGDKVIESGFFGKPDVENISAVMFTNSGTHAKFTRMGYQHGVGCDRLVITRQGMFYDPDPDARDPAFLAYNLDNPPFVESWGQGLVVIHNPNALHPLPHDYFVGAVQMYLGNDGLLKTDMPPWHPFGSQTCTLHIGEYKAKLQKLYPSGLLISSITKESFRFLIGMAVQDQNLILEEDGWFADDAGAFLGVLVRDKVDDDWGYFVLARDQYMTFRHIESGVSFPSRDEARQHLFSKMVKLLSHPRRIFEQ